MTDGPSNWTNMLLKSHESSQKHEHNMATWTELELHLKTGKIIDQAEMLPSEDVLARSISIIQSVADRNLCIEGIQWHSTCKTMETF